MAAPAHVKIRLYNPGRDCIYGDTSNVLPNYLEKPIAGLRKKYRYFEILHVGEAPNGAELGTAANATKDGTTTPFQVTVVSAAATDVDTSVGHVRKVALIGVTVSDADGRALNVSRAKLTVEVVNMNGTTDVVASRWYLREPIAAYACHWGSGGADAADAITIESPANTTLLTIAQAANESNGGTLYFADGDMVRHDYINIQPYATQAAADGLTISLTYKGFDQTLNQDPDMMVDYYTHLATRSVPSMPMRPCRLVPEMARLTNSLLLTGTLIANAITYKVHIGIQLHNKAIKS